MNRREFLKYAICLTVISSLPYSCGGSAENTNNNDKNQTQKMGILIPLYSYPNWYDQDYQWQKLIDLKNKYKEIEIIAIVNPNNGEFNERNPDYEKGIKDLIKANIKVIGYVYTGYASRDKTLIKNNIDAWDRFYKDIGVSGIFFDEVSELKEDLEFYKEISNYAKSKGFNFIVLNPGIKTDQSYIDSKIANIIVTYENSYEEFKNNTIENNTPNEYTKLAILLHSLNENKIERLITIAKEKNFNYVYFTDDTLPNPWDSISSYLEDIINVVLNT